MKIKSFIHSLEKCPAFPQLPHRPLSPPPPVGQSRAKWPTMKFLSGNLSGEVEAHTLRTFLALNSLSGTRLRAFLGAVPGLPGRLLASDFVVKKYVEGMKTHLQLRHANLSGRGFGPVF
jgi:hypothetical protein